MLSRALTSWLHVQHLDQIVILDWSSDPPLLPIVTEHLRAVKGKVPSVRVLRVENETDWVLSRAYNLAIHHASFESVFKVDCDYIVHEHTFRQHPLDSNKHFFTGYYMNSRNANEMHLNGALFVKQTLFWSVAGYDERIQTYGYDDEDLYQRLVNTGASRLNVSYDYVSHIPHEDKHRGQDGVKFPRVQIDINRILLERIAKPWGVSNRGSEYAILNGNNNLLRAVFVPLDLKAIAGDKKYTEARRLALGRRLHDDFLVPWGVISSLDIPTSEMLLRRFNTRKEVANFDEVAQEGKAPRFILVHVQNGLGNRLRTLASGLAFATKTNREPIIIWERDIHFGAYYSDIFNASSTKFAVLNAFKPQWPLKGNAEWDKAWSIVDFYNYMLSEDVGKVIPDDPARNIYFKSSAIMNTNLTTWESENAELRSLLVREEVIQMASNIYGDGMDKVGGVQIRNRSLDEDLIDVKDKRDLYSKQDAALLDKWRALTKVDNFIPTMRQMLNNGTVNKFFVASDTIAVLQQLRRNFSEGQIVYIDRDCDDRSARCQKFAMADLLVLARVKKLLGSTWSSFTEAAMRLGGPKAMLAGK